MNSELNQWLEDNGLEIVELTIVQDGHPRRLRVIAVKAEQTANPADQSNGE
jgi:hypothetical protein